MQKVSMAEDEFDPGLGTFIVMADFDRRSIKSIIPTDTNIPPLLHNFHAHICHFGTLPLLPKVIFSNPIVTVSADT